MGRPRTAALRAVDPATRRTMSASRCDRLASPCLTMDRPGADARGKARVRRRRGVAGFTLVELLVGIGLLALFALVMQQFCRTVLRGVRVLEVASEAQEAARLAAQLIVADLRESGYSPT